MVNKNFVELHTSVCVCLFIVQLMEKFCNEEFDVFLARTGIQRSDLWDETLVCNQTFLRFSLFNH